MAGGALILHSREDRLDPPELPARLAHAELREERGELGVALAVHHPVHRLAVFVVDERDEILAAEGERLLATEAAHLHELLVDEHDAVALHDHQLLERTFDEPLIRLVHALALDGGADGVGDDPQRVDLRLEPNALLDAIVQPHHAPPHALDKDGHKRDGAGGNAFTKHSLGFGKAPRRAVHRVPRAQSFLPTGKPRLVELEVLHFRIVDERGDVLVAPFVDDREDGDAVAIDDLGEVGARGARGFAEVEQRVVDRQLPTGKVEQFLGGVGGGLEDAILPFELPRVEPLAGYVLQRADEFDRLAALVEGGTGDGANPADVAVGANDAELAAILGAAIDDRKRFGTHAFAVVRMGAVEEDLRVQAAARLVNAENSIEFRRIFPILAFEVVLPHADARDALRLRQRLLADAQLL